MKQKSRISIIIPHYNSPKKLDRLLDSIPKKDEIQIIVVDDLSTKDLDEYNNVIQKNRNRVEFYQNTLDNKSAGGARNVGLEKAVGEWLLFADADDFFTDTFWDVIEKYLDLEFDIVFFAPLAIIEGTNRASARSIHCANLTYNAWIEKNKNEKISRKAELNIRYRWSFPFSKLIKKDLVDKNNIKFDVVKFSNDVNFSSKVGFYARTIDVSYEPIYVITEGKGTLTTSRDDPNEDKIREEILKQHCNFWRNNLSYEDGILLFSYSWKEKIKYFIKKKILRV